MTTLAIMATYEKKRLKCYGTVAAGEHVAVTVTDGAQWIGAGKALRLRVLLGPETVAVFPFAEGDAWTVAGTQDADATCELNLNSIQAEKYLKHGGTCLLILDDVENHTLYATGEFDVLPWPKRRGVDEPIDLDGYPQLIEDMEGLKEAWDAYQRTISQALAAKQDTISDLQVIRKGAAAGASALQPVQILDDGKIKSDLLPSYVDDVVEYVSRTAFPEAGESGKIYIALDTGNCYRWSGSTYVEISPAPDMRNYVPTSRTVNGKALSADVELTAADVPYSPGDTITVQSAIESFRTSKQDVLTFDAMPTANSTNPVTSGGVADALAGKVSKAGDTMTGPLTVPTLTVGSRKSGSTVGSISVAEGYDTTASGGVSHAEGDSTAAYGYASHAEGDSTAAYGYASHAEGNSTTASGGVSHAEGYLTTASGYASHAEGEFTTAQNQAEHAQGRCNTSHKVSDAFGDGGNTLDSIGIGISNTARKNATEVMQDGKMFLLGVGGYDGTNPTGQANAATDLAAVVNGKLDTSGGTLAERGCTEWVFSPSQYNGEDIEARFEFQPDDGVTPGFAPYAGDERIGTWRPDKDNGQYVLSRSWGTDAVMPMTATRTKLPGYVLGTQTDKPLASEAEAEALRSDVNGKLDAAPLSGNTYDFATTGGFMAALKAVIETLGGFVTNFPAASSN